MYLIEPSELTSGSYHVLENGFFMGQILKGAENTWCFDKHGKREASVELLKEISEKLFSLNKELRDETRNLAQEFDCETGKQGAD